MVEKENEEHEHTKTVEYARIHDNNSYRFHQRKKKIQRFDSLTRVDSYNHAQNKFVTVTDKQEDPNW